MPDSDPTIDIKPRSRVVTDCIEATTSRALLAVALSGGPALDMSQTGIASSSSERSSYRRRMSRTPPGSQV